MPREQVGTKGREKGTAGSTSVKKGQKGRGWSVKKGQKRAVRMAPKRAVLAPAAYGVTSVVSQVKVKGKEERSKGRDTRL